MIAYFIKSFICLALLLAFYHLVLEREKMHQFNRFYLLGSILFSFVAPLYKIYIEVAQTIAENIQPLALDYPIPTEIIEPVQETNYMQYALFVYLIISLILTIRFIKNLVAIYLKTKQHQKIKKGKATLVLVNDLISPHTFWNYIFINKEEYNSNKIETELYTHELTHALQKHTFDILLIELLQIIFWINPTYILLKKAIKLNHEFLADNNVITTHKNTSEYQYLLLNRAAWSNEYYLASNLNYLLTKKRLLMMTKQSSRTKILFKKLAVIPVLAGFTFLFAERVEAETSEIKYVDSEIIDKQKHKKSSSTEIFKDINDKLKNVNSLKLSIVQNDTFSIKPTNGETIKIWENKVDDYLELYKTYETLRNQKPHYIKSSHKRKELLNNIYSKLGTLYFRLSKTDKQKVKRAKHPKHPYIKLKKNNKVYYKLWSELSEDEKKLLPPPPPKPKTQVLAPPPPKTGFYESNGQKLYYVQKGKKFTFYNKHGQIVSKEGKIINPEQTASNKVIPGQNITKVYKDNKVVTRFKNTNLPPPPPKANFPEVKKGEESNIPPPAPIVKKEKHSNIPPPPPPMSAEELVNKYPNAIYYFNNKKVDHKKVLRLVENQKGLSVLTQEKDGKKVIKFTSKDYVKKGLIKVNNQTIYYVKKSGKTEYFDRWGNAVNKDGEILKINKSKKAKHKISFDKGKKITYYLDGKIITKKEREKIHPDDIKTINVKKEKDGSGAIYIIRKK